MTVKATDANNLVQELQLRIVSSVYEHPHYTEKNGCRKNNEPHCCKNKQSHILDFAICKF